MNYQEPIKRKAGRPKGAKSTKPRKSTAEYKAEREKRLPWRPTAYTDDLPDKLHAYFFAPLKTADLCGTQVIDWPTLVEFCEANKLSYGTVMRWLKDEDKEALRLEYNACQEHVKGLRQRAAEHRIVDPAFEKFLLSATYGMKEESSVTIGQDEERPFQVKIDIV